MNKQGLHIFLRSWVLFSFILLASCVKDVDLDQAEDINLAPDLQISLLYYNLNESDFLDSETSAYTSVIRDTVRLEFLDDDYVQDGLQNAEFRFRHENQFQFPIRSSIKFLDKQGRRQFQVDYIIPAGAAGAAGVIDTIHDVDNSQINQVRRSIQMALELEMIGGDQNLKGELDFSSKGRFKFEF